MFSQASWGQDGKKMCVEQEKNASHQQLPSPG
uniref:Uncharacterized protein n=1 Tax=Anguilla anguilla TaxID=7936 RepID=A0A0E9QPQ6_ANGAN